MIGKGMLSERGIVPPEDAIDGSLYAHFMNELGKRDIIVLETVETDVP